MISNLLSYWKILRLNLVLFFLYLIGDAFYRWDGFRYYASLYEFIVSFGFVSILCSLLVVVVSAFMWLPLKIYEWLSLRYKWKIGVEYLLLFCNLFIIIGTITWLLKLLLFGGGSNLQQKLIVLFFVISVSFYLAWFLRDRSNLLSEHITPLVGLVFIILTISLPLVAYHIWFRDSETKKEHYSLSEAHSNRPDIILLTFDALTARDMSTYGYYRETTPFISKWAESASLFTRAKADSNITSSTTSSLMTGKRSFTHQVYHMPLHSTPLKGNFENLVLELKKNNYYTMAYVENEAATPGALGISGSFDSIYPFIYEPYYREWLHRISRDKIRLFSWIITKDFLPARFIHYIFSRRYIKNIIFNKSTSTGKNNYSSPITWFSAQDRPPGHFFLWIHLMPPHDPYSPPEPYLGTFERLSKNKGFIQATAFARIQKALSDFGYFTKEVQPLVYTLRARYDEYIRYCDKLFEDIIEDLEEKNLLKNTLIVLSSDHGESFEHNYIIHGSSPLYEQVTHIPLIIKEPGQVEGRVIDNLTAQIDIPATILDLAGKPVPSWMEGRSLVPLIRNTELPFRPVFSMNFQKNPSRGHKIIKGTIAVWKGDYKLIQYIDKEKTLLFNLKNDPGEMNNIFQTEYEEGQSLLKLVKDNLNMANERMRLQH